jgi:class 3 adenylate cyclase
MVARRAARWVERRLGAILAADVAGYSRLTGLDEEGTHAQLQVRSLVVAKTLSTGNGSSHDRGRFP